MTSTTSTTPSNDTGIGEQDGHLGMSRGTRRAIASVAALIGAGTAATVLAAPADAAPSYTKVWSKVASCESGGDWHINTGNGYYGGVQFSASTWAANGGHKYAAQASGASKREQIEVARRVLRSQGPGAWPVCGAHAGLTKGNGAATSKKLPPSDETMAAAKKADAKKADAKKAAAKKAEATKARPKPAPRPKPVAAHKHVAKHRATPGNTTHGKRYVVQSGDTLSAIVRKLQLDTTWKHLATFNRLANPDVLHIGQVLHLPSS